MRIGIISDIHGNLEAAGAVIEFFKDKIDFLVSLGDVVGYGPDPEECLNLILKEANVILKGNHEEGIITGDISRFKNTAKVSLEWTKKNLSPATIEKLKKLPEKEVRGDTCFVHASISSPLFKYILRKEDAEEEFSLLTQKICFFGHTHIPGGFKKDIGLDRTETIYPDFSGKMKIEIQDGFKYLINVGSVGQPRDGLPFACASIYETDKKVFTLHRIEYPVEITRRKIIEGGLPSVLARRIIQGI
jgi:predicted phosphodiesterase